jgi:pimeloyl-ACP methyl ester carboxylesterase/membrane protein DedA with SNARE-associated domain
MWPWIRRRWWIVYLVLLVASHAVIALWNPNVWTGRTRPASTETITVAVREMTDAGPTTRDASLVLWKWSPKSPVPGRPPILLLHGSPSAGARDFARFAPMLADRGFEVYALDRPGFGNSAPWVRSYSILANARYALAAMDAMSIDRFHIVGWSQGGGAAIHAADLAPQRIVTMTLIGSIGIQRGEGSGDYRFEHTKYRLGYAAVVILPELIPHFGILPDRAVRHAFIRDFMDTDQRPIEAMLPTIDTPSLILQGRHDPLVHAWVAEEHHRLLPASRLVMLDASHFFVFGEPMDDAEDTTLAADVMTRFFTRHDAPGVPVLRGSADFAPVLKKPFDGFGAFHLSRSAPWWVIVLAIIVGTLVSEDLTVIAVGLLIASGQLDVGVGAIGCLLGIVVGDYGLWAIGRFFGRRVLRWPLFRKALPESSLEKWGRIFDRHTAKAVFLSRALPGTRLPMYLAAGILGKRSRLFLFWVTVAVLIWTPVLLLLAAIIGPKLLGFFEGVFHGPWVILASFIALALIIRLVSYEATSLGRQRLKRDIRLIVSPEFWPAWIFYIPLAPWIAMLALRHGPMAFTAANPGIANGGGVVGESKAQIASGFPAGTPFLPCARIPAGGTPDQRADLARAILRERPDIGGLPAILKPDFAQRGHAVRIVRTEDDIVDYLRTMERDALLQRLHPGPVEIGLFWMRIPRPGVPLDECPGEVFSITRKEFPIIEGDGERTLERLIWDHPRFRMQATTFLARFASMSDRVLARGETLRLAQSGNHCQGTKFLDGADLITPELSAAIESIAQSFRDPITGKAFDFGRFDIRCESEESLRAGRGLAIVELNGTMSESTNIYDPKKPIWWVYGVLFRQWSRLYRIGAARATEGSRPISLKAVIGHVRDHYRGRPGSSVAD